MFDSLSSGGAVIDNPVAADLLERRASHFLIWRPNRSTVPPKIVIGRFQAGNPPTLAGERRLSLTAAPGANGLWLIAPRDCGLTQGNTFHYSFPVEATHPQRP